jgi:hypothetical protein
MRKRNSTSYEKNGNKIPIRFNYLTNQKVTPMVFMALKKVPEKDGSTTSYVLNPD